MMWSALESKVSAEYSLLIPSTVGWVWPVMMCSDTRTQAIRYMEDVGGGGQRIPEKRCRSERSTLRDGIYENPRLAGTVAANVAERCRPRVSRGCVRAGTDSLAERGGREAEASKAAGALCERRLLRLRPAAVVQAALVHSLLQVLFFVNSRQAIDADATG